MSICSGKSTFLFTLLPNILLKSNLFNCTVSTLGSFCRVKRFCALVIFLQLCVCVCVCVCVRVSVWACVCACVCMCVWTSVWKGIVKGGVYKSISRPHTTKMSTLLNHKPETDSISLATSPLKLHHLKKSLFILHNIIPMTMSITL